MREDLIAAGELLAAFPYAGPELSNRGAESLRRLKLPHTPFIVWYVVASGGATVTFLRLFHTRQVLPSPRAGS